jgi:hypothetical protein
VRIYGRLCHFKYLEIEDVRSFAPPGLAHFGLALPTARAALRLRSGQAFAANKIDQILGRAGSASTRCVIRLATGL